MNCVLIVAVIAEKNLHSDFTLLITFGKLESHNDKPRVISFTVNTSVNVNYSHEYSLNTSTQKKESLAPLVTKSFSQKHVWHKLILTKICFSRNQFFINPLENQSINTCTHNIRFVTACYTMFQVVARLREDLEAEHARNMEETVAKLTAEHSQLVETLKAEHTQSQETLTQGLETVKSQLEYENEQLRVSYFVSPWCSCWRVAVSQNPQLGNLYCLRVKGLVLH